jgi:hypothetical protein
MNIMYLCMGKMLDVYYDVSKTLLKNNNQINPTFFVSDRMHFSKFDKNNKQFKKEECYLSEWSLTEKITNDFDMQALKNLEKKYFKDTSIWEPLMADRRVFMGGLCKYTQDYKPSLGYKEMMSLLVESIKSIEDFFDTNRPDVVVGFTIATFGEYLISLVAKERGVKFIQLRHTKIKNYYTFSSDLHEGFESIRKEYEKGTHDKDNNNFIDNYIDEATNKGMTYEGTVGYKDSVKTIFMEYPKQFLISIINDFKYLKVKKDGHYKVAFIKIFFYDKLYRFFKKKYQDRVLSKTYIDKSELNKKSYAFYPLHAEPEIAISIFSIFYQNQIEVIRNISMSLPAGYKLLVKEHPRNIGRRSTSYYNKISQIPNVELVDAYCNTSYIISNSRIVVVLQGFLGFEALMHDIPVISLGSAMYNMLPKKMINHVENIKNIREEIIFSLSNFSNDKDIIRKYIHAILLNSTNLDLYTVLLNKVGRSGGSEFSDELYVENISRLTDLLIKEIS